MSIKSNVLAARVNTDVYAIVMIAIGAPKLSPMHVGMGVSACWRLLVGRHAVAKKGGSIIG